MPFGATIVSLLGFAFTAPDMSNVDESLSVEVAQIQSGNYSSIFASYLVSLRDQECLCVV